MCVLVVIMPSMPTTSTGSSVPLSGIDAKPNSLKRAQPRGIDGKVVYSRHSDAR